MTIQIPTLKMKNDVDNLVVITFSIMGVIIHRCSQVISIKKSKTSPNFIDLELQNGSTCSTKV
jgi:hypothetical protein